MRRPLPAIQVATLALTALLALGSGAAVPAVAGCAPGRPATPAARAAARSGGTHAVVKSNVTAADYAGSDACTPCHSDIASSFAGSAMHRMTRLADRADVKAPFAGETLEFKDDRASLVRKGAARFVRLENAGAPPRLYRVTRVLGGHYREDFVGVPVAREDDETAAGLAGKTDELVLPVSYLIEQQRLRYKGYSVLIHERSALEPGPVWNRTCLLCHNTSPYLWSLYGALAGDRAPHYQGEVVDPLLPDSRALRYVVTDRGALAEAVAAEVLRATGVRLDAGGDTGRLLRRAIDVTRDRLTGSALLEVGIGCESCHGGSREHVKAPGVLPTFEPVAPFLAARRAGPDARSPPSRAELESRACARCHQVLFSRYPFTWEGGKRYASPGGSPINSGEARDFLLGGCSGSMTCTACHDPHATDDRARLAELATPAGNRVCTGCHPKLAPPDALRAHAHHDPAGAGGACIACHMPRKNMGLDAGLTRYHAIGSPTDPIRVMNDRPLECAVCHQDRSASDLLGAMRRFWNRTYDDVAIRALYGDPSSSVLLATIERGKPHERAIAMALLAEHPTRQMATRFAGELVDDYPLVREYARTAFLRAIAAGPPQRGGLPSAPLPPTCTLSMYSARDRLEAQAGACLTALGLPTPTWAPAAPNAAPAAEPAED